MENVTAWNMGHYMKNALLGMNVNTYIVCTFDDEETEFEYQRNEIDNLISEWEGQSIRSIGILDTPFPGRIMITMA